jgi:hypothetical protein
MAATTPMTAKAKLAALGKTDLEILETLKTIIKEGQHEVYRAVPMPESLAEIFLGPLPEVKKDPEPGAESADSGTRPPRLQKDKDIATRRIANDATIEILKNEDNSGVGILL